MTQLVCNEPYIARASLPVLQTARPDTRIVSSCIVSWELLSLSQAPLAPDLFSGLHDYTRTRRKTEDGSRNFFPSVALPIAEGLVRAKWSTSVQDCDSVATYIPRHKARTRHRPWRTPTELVTFNSAVNARRKVINARVHGPVNPAIYFLHAKARPALSTPIGRVPDLGLPPFRFQSQIARTQNPSEPGRYAVSGYCFIDSACIRSYRLRYGFETRATTARDTSVGTATPRERLVQCDINYFLGLPGEGRVHGRIR